MGLKFKKGRSGISLLIVPVIENEIAKTLVEGPLPSESDESVSIGH